MATLPVILVNGDGTSEWTGSYTAIDEAVDAVGADLDIVATPNGAAATAFFLLQDTPADFESMTSLTLNIRYRQSGRTDDNMGLFAQVFAADETTPLTNEFTVNSAVTALVFGNSGVLNFTGVVASDKTTWDGARIRLRCTYSQTMGKDSSFTIDVSALQLGGVYTAVIPPEIVAASDTLAATLAEASLSALTSAASDTLGATISESPDLVGILAKADTAALALADSSGGGIERLAPDAILTQTNLTGVLADIQDDPDSADANWLVESGASVLRTSFPTPAGKLKGTQEIRIKVRPS